MLFEYVFSMANPSFMCTDITGVRQNTEKNPSVKWDDNVFISDMTIGFLLKLTLFYFL